MSTEDQIPAFNIDDVAQIKYAPVPEKEWEDKPVVFYCVDCAKIVPVKRIGKKVQFNCAECQGKKVVYGTEEGIKNYFHIKS